MIVGLAPRTTGSALDELVFKLDDIVTIDDEVATELLAASVEELAGAVVALLLKQPCS